MANKSFSSKSNSVIAREKMSITRRAKQFMPFAALTGLDEALRKKEWEIEARPTG